MTSSIMTVRVDDHLKKRLEKLAVATHRSKSFLAGEALAEYLNLHEWQISEIKSGLIEADSGKLVEHKSIVQHWEKKRAHSMDRRRKPKSKSD